MEKTLNESAIDLSLKYIKGIRFAQYDYLVSSQESYTRGFLAGVMLGDTISFDQYKVLQVLAQNAAEHRRKEFQNKA